ncbi:hypothetical protein COLO4_24397 [Corchorus olitorius]|uniref:Uncharacterized protein n=1 Tax=Corchorus olitorius TaxID=93759 RepID=A0A1R3IAG6_9ROSI|nr:hypothetical protein COLO4_24397 [Corchorus olitorius]
MRRAQRVKSPPIYERESLPLKEELSSEDKISSTPSLLTVQPIRIELSN